MNADADTRKFSQLVLADTSLQRGLKEGLVVDMSLLVPQKKLQGSGSESLGGFMGVPLRELRLGKGSRPFSVDDFLGQEAVKRNEEVILVLDTGSQGFWVMDMTQGADGTNLLEKATLGTQVGDYELVLGDRGGSTFTLTIPQQWRDFEGGAELLKTPPSFVKNQGLQCLIVGNPFLQAVAMTFAPSQSPPKAYFSHLDARGQRCQAYAGPKSDVRAPAQGSFASLTGQQHVRSGKIPLKDGRLHISSLVETSLATAAPPTASSQKAKDVTLDLRFMKFPVNSKQKGGAQTISVESTSARDLVVPCLDVLVKDAAGNQVYNTHIFDTGSGVNLSLDVDLDPATTRSCEGAACYCASPGKVGDVFAKSIASNAGPSCKKCARPMLEAKQGGGSGICNTSCCTSEGVSCDDQMPCSVVFCTGVVSYSPRFARMSFPSEVSGKAQKRHLQDVPRVFVGKAQAACVPGVQSGLFGAWYWDSPLKPPGTGSAAALEASGLPYYLLEHIGQIATPDENYTLKFWRTDLNTAKKSLAVGADASARPGPVPSRPWWDGGTPAPGPSPPPSPEPSPPPTPEPSPPPAPEPSPPPAPEPSPPPTPEPSPPPAPEPSPQPAPPSPDAPPYVPPPPGACPTGPGPSGAVQRLDGVGDNSNGKQQIVIMTPQGGGSQAPLLTGAGGGGGDAGSARKRDWVVIGLSIAAVALLVVLLVVSIRQYSSSDI